MGSGQVSYLNDSACCISHEFYKAATRSPNKIAVIHATKSPRKTNLVSSSRPPVYHGDQYFTFSEILAAVESLSSRLTRIFDGFDDPCLIKPSRGHNSCDKSDEFSGPLHSPCIQPCAKLRNARAPKVVAVYMEPSVEYIVSVLSVMRCGEAFMPLETTWPNARVLSLIASSKADLIIGYKISSEGRFFHRLDMLQWLIDDGSCSILPISMKEDLKEQSPPVQFECPRELKNSRSFCYLMYTSGSSGKPKGVCGTEVGLLNRYLWMKRLYPLHDGDVSLFKTPISFVDHLQEFLGPVLSTCTLVIPPFNQLKENITLLVDFLQGYVIGGLIAVPSLMKAILPALESPFLTIIQDSLKLLVLSGETLQLSLVENLMKLLPQTAILNLYGSTEVTGDCTYFDCKRLPLILENEVLDSVPIGLPISNCDVLLVGEDAPNQGEVVVGGPCVAAGYFQYPHLIPFADAVVPLCQNSGCSTELCRNQTYFRTGDFARKLPTGDLVFLGRKDRLLKLNGQRIALEEIENVLNDHPDLIDAAVISRKVEGEILILEAHLVTGKRDGDYTLLKHSLKTWLQSKLPQAMIPTLIRFTSSLPLTSSGKVDYLSIAASAHPCKQDRINIKETTEDSLIQVIKKVLYAHPTPLSLRAAISSPTSSGANALGVNLTGPEEGRPNTKRSRILDFDGSKPCGNFFHRDGDAYLFNTQKHLKRMNRFANSANQRPRDTSRSPTLLHTKCSFGRCNKSVHAEQCGEKLLPETVWSDMTPRGRKGCMQVLWKVNMNSCVDASPLVVSQGGCIYVFIGSHSHKFICVDAQSGGVQWETKLEGRVECSAAILDDFSQVVVGCYNGNIYFLHFANGSVCGSFRTNGEVKAQPVVDKCRNLVWCGSYDQNLYAIDYRNYCCIYKLSCGGSVFGSPAIDEMQETLYVPSTSGHVTALSIKAMPFKKLWGQDLGAPIFGSLTINNYNRNIICCLVDGSVRGLSACGSTVWKAITGGPIFAGPCTSPALPSELLICSRDGSLYSFEMETGVLLWKHAIGHPITSSPYVDEHLQVISNGSSGSERLICVCDSSGSIHVLSVGANVSGGLKENTNHVVEEFARLDLQGDIFSSPVMIGGRIFVGCRDDYLYCIMLDTE